MAPLPQPPRTSALAALAALLEDSVPYDDPVSQLSALLGALSEEEASAVKEFEAAGQRCYAKLRETTVSTLRSIDLRQGLAGPGNAGLQEEMRKVRDMFHTLDTEHVGKIERERFKEMLTHIGVDQYFSQDELDALLTAADKNKDNFIELEEFMEWVYSAGPDEGHGSARLGEDASDNDDRQKFQEVKAALDQAQAKLADAESDKRSELKQMERRQEEELQKAIASHEAELEASHRFWRSVAQSSAGAKLGKAVDLSSARLIGNGKYGFVFKTTRTCKAADEDVGSTVVVKLLSVRWAHVAAKEYQWAQAVKGHPHIVDYKDVILHADDDKMVLELLKAAQEQGKLQSKTKRSVFPDRYLCLTQEFMNRGTVQDWMDREILMAGGMLVVMRSVAGALAHMHQHGLTHNDIKPENIFLAQPEPAATASRPAASAGGEVIVKLGDLGLADRSTDRSNDFSQYGMTTLCMTTGEKFGTRKFQQHLVVDFINEVASLVGEAGSDAEVGDIAKTLAELPEILRRVWGAEVTMAELRDWPSLQNWGFFDGAPEDHEQPIFPETPKAPKSITKIRTADVDAVLETDICSARRMEQSVSEAGPF